MPKVILQPTGHRDIFTDGSDFEPLWSRSQDFGGEIRYWHQSGYGSFPESDVQIDACGVPGAGKTVDGKE
jgi:hypothetical protein